MDSVTVRDIRSFRRCPFAFRQSKISKRWTITSDECMDLSVGDAILFRESKRIMGLECNIDSILSAYWDSWDRHFPDVYMPQPNNMELIRYGEKCVRNHEMLMESSRDRMLSSGCTGSVDLPSGKSIIVAADDIRMRGRTAVVTRYVTDPIIRSRDDLSSDLEMRLMAFWAGMNIADCSTIVMRWEFLGPGIAVEAQATRSMMNDAVQEASAILSEMTADSEILPNESSYCGMCPYLDLCPRHAHELSLSKDPGAMETDLGVKLVDEIDELQEKIDALTKRRESLELKKGVLESELVSFADSKGYMSVTGHSSKALIRHEKKVDLPQDKTALIDRLKETGQYDSISMVNYPRLRSEISKGTADPVISGMANIVNVDKVYMRKRIDR